MLVSSAPFAYICRIAKSTLFLFLLLMPSISAQDFDQEFERLLLAGDWQAVKDRLEDVTHDDESVAALIYDNCCLALDLSCATSFLETNPDQPWRDSETKKWMHNFVKKHQDNAIAHVLDASLKARMGMSKAADKALDEALTRDPHLALAHYYRGILYLMMRSPRRARDAYSKALEIDSGFAKAWLGQGSAFDAARIYDSALYAYNMGLATGKDSGYFFYNRGNTYGKMGKHREAISDYTAALTHNIPSVAVYLNRGNDYLELGKTDSALADYERFVAEARGPLESRVPAIEALIRSLRERKNLDNRPTKSIGLSRCERLFKEGKYDEALMACSKAIESNSSEYDAYYFRASSHLRIGNLGKAIEDFSVVINLHPNDTTAYYNRGLCRSLLGDYVNAKEDFSGAIRCNKQYVNAYRERAWVLEQLGDSEGERADYQTLKILIDRTPPGAEQSSYPILDKLEKPSRPVHDYGAKKQVERAYRALIDQEPDRILECLSGDLLKDFRIRCEPMVQVMVGDGAQFVMVGEMILSTNSFMSCPPSVFLPIFFSVLQSTAIARDTTFSIDSVKVLDAAQFGNNNVIVRSYLYVTKNGQSRLEVVHDVAHKRNKRWVIESAFQMIGLFADD